VNLKRARDDRSDVARPGTARVQGPRGSVMAGVGDPGHGTDLAEDRGYRSTCPARGNRELRRLPLSTIRLRGAVGPIDTTGWAKLATQDLRVCGSALRVVEALAPQPVVHVAVQLGQQGVVHGLVLGAVGGDHAGWKVCYVKASARLADAERAAIAGCPASRAVVSSSSADRSSDSSQASCWSRLSFCWRVT
jgi:hypothetical protein